MNVGKIEFVAEIHFLCICKQHYMTNACASHKNRQCLQILKLSNLFKLQVTSFVYECLNSLAPIYFREYFTSIQSIHSIGTRQSKKGDLYALRCNTTQYGLRSIHFSGVRIWNSLPVEIRNSQSLPNFKKKMKAYIFSFYKF